MRRPLPRERTLPCDAARHFSQCPAPRVTQTHKLPWTGAYLAKLLDLTPRRVRQLADDGVFKKEARDRYSPSAVTDYIKYLRERISDPPAPKEFWEARDEDGQLMGYFRDEPQLFITIDMTAENTGKSLETVSRAARGLADANVTARTIQVFRIPEYGRPSAFGCDVPNGTRHHRTSEDRRPLDSPGIA